MLIISKISSSLYLSLAHLSPSVVSSHLHPWRFKFVGPLRVAPPCEANFLSSFDREPPFAKRKEHWRRSCLFVVVGAKGTTFALLGLSWSQGYCGIFGDCFAVFWFGLILPCVDLGCCALSLRVLLLVIELGLRILDLAMNNNWFEMKKEIIKNELKN